MFKIENILPAVIAAIGLAFSPLTVLAEDLPVNPAPPLAYGVPQILKLAQAKVTDDVIIAYIHNSGNSYGLDADQIIYLRQQGISDKVMTTMLAQPRPAFVPAPTAPAPVNSYPVQTPGAYPQPTPAYDQTAPASSVYVIPNNQIYYSTWYPYYYYPYVTYSYGWCGGYHGNCYYRGGYCGAGYYHGYHGGYCYGNAYHGGNLHGGVAFASRSANSHGGGSFGGGFHGGGMMHH
jgi:hypothetical protein